MPPESTSRSKGPRPVRVALLSFAAALVLGELALRLLGLPSDSGFQFFGPLARRDVFVADRDRFWRLSPDTPHFTANDAGLRGWLPDGPKGPRDLRLSVVGDSCTFGTGVRYEETYGLRLERMLQHALPGARVECLVAALPGYTSHQSRILYAEEVAPRRPDLTVLYVGGFNDYVAAIGPSDRERAALRDRAWRRAAETTRVGRYMVRAFDPELAAEADGETIEQAFATGEAPMGRRVPLDDFRDNYDDLIRQARDVGSHVIVVLPQVADRTLQFHPIAFEYRAAIRELAAEHDLPLIDMPALFEPYRYDAPPDWPESSRGLWPCFVDGVHPSSFGHELLAGAIFARLGDWVDERARATGTPPEDPRATALEPADVTTGRALALDVVGAGFRGEAGPERVWIGERQVRRFEIVDDTRLRLELPVDLPPGTWPLELNGPLGLTVGPELTVRPADLRVQASREGGAVRVVASGHGPPRWHAVAWLALERRDPPAPTRFGPFELAAEPDGRPPGRDGPFAFERLALIQLLATCDEDGSWTSDRELDLGPNPPARLEVQALCLENFGRAVLTETVTVPVEQ